MHHKSSVPNKWRADNRSVGDTDEGNKYAKEYPRYLTGRYQTRVPGEHQRQRADNLR